MEVGSPPPFTEREAASGPDGLFVDAMFRPDGDSAKPGGVFPFAILEAVAFEHFQEGELVLDRDAGVEAPAHIGDVELHRRITGVGGQQAALFHKASYRFHGRHLPPYLLS